MVALIRTCTGILDECNDKPNYHVRKIFTLGTVRFQNLQFGWEIRLNSSHSNSFHVNFHHCLDLNLCDSF